MLLLPIRCCPFSFDSSSVIGDTSVETDNLDNIPDETRNVVETEIVDNIPDEMRNVEVDMNDPNMDPLEWTVRKTVPIPKAYYWDTGNENIPKSTKAWHHTVNVLSKVLKVAERAGELVADISGLNSTQYDYVTANMTEEEWKEAKKTMEIRNIQRRKSMEERRNSVDQAKVLEDAGLARAGELVADISGLNSTQYDYVTVSSKIILLFILQVRMISFFSLMHFSCSGKYD
uniref:Uncharacterized protein n=1 Tax=Corethron hystrix TaxID=216773 RepID=A0A7S1BCS2_9STRA|mmetsp:Transcript_22268/g.50997  ORF Transcript_22268/g.50997 Transcript_22268/m.50997 type:complete len:231 (+) Transcript_22268:259-951(+)